MRTIDPHLHLVCSVAISITKETFVRKYLVLFILIGVAAFLFGLVIVPDIKTEYTVMNLCREHAPQVNQTVVLEIQDCPIGLLSFGGTQMNNIRYANGNIKREASHKSIGYSYTALTNDTRVGIYPSDPSLESVIFVRWDPDDKDYGILFESDESTAVFYTDTSSFTACRNDGKTVQCVSVLTIYNEFYQDYDAMVWAMAFVP